MAKLPTKQGLGQSGPIPPRIAIEQWIGRDIGGLNPYPAAVRDAAKLLARMHPWPATLGLYEFQQAVYAYDLMLARDEGWDRMPQGARDKWIEKFEATTAQLLKLMEQAPRPPEKHGFPVRDVLLLLAIEHGLGIAVPPEGDPERWRTMLAYEEAFDRSGINLSHALMIFRQDQRADYNVRQPLPKPGDSGADRVFFVVSLWRYTELTAREIAEIASCMLDGETIEPADVHRWVRAYSKQKVRFFSGQKKPSSTER